MWRRVAVLRTDVSEERNLARVTLHHIRESDILNGILIIAICWREQSEGDLRPYNNRVFTQHRSLGLPGIDLRPYNNRTFTQHRSLGLPGIDLRPYNNRAFTQHRSRGLPGIVTFSTAALDLVFVLLVSFPNLVATRDYVE
jgi:hypothetical protein